MNRKRKAVVEDTRMVDIEDEYALELWTREFNVSEEKLKAAVMIAGQAVPDVKRQLKK